MKKALKAFVEIASRKVEKKAQEPQVPQVEKCVSVPATRLRTVARTRPAATRLSSSSAILGNPSRQAA